MTKEIQSSKDERRLGVRSGSLFGFRCSFGFRDSSFGFGNYGSWKAPFRFLRMHWDHEPTPNPPGGELKSTEERRHPSSPSAYPSRQSLSRGSVSTYLFQSSNST